MSAYRCYFHRPAVTLSSVSSSIDTSNEFTTDEFTVDTDEQARLMVETLYKVRSSRVQGFELWEGDRLVLRHCSDGATCENQIAKTEHVHLTDRDMFPEEARSRGNAGSEYRCCFLRPATIRFGAPISIDNIEEFTAATDDEARLMAEMMYQNREGQVHGYELWQSTRLVRRHPVAAPSEDLVVANGSPFATEEPTLYRQDLDDFPGRRSGYG